ncbi:hypothetical protein AWB68_08876 [Caballeronia choica]|uniref:Uncharacterized protein n=1 Tax=Caballeronia choica TaxID=326476 RepID=A0A158L6V9_9BURK|nr:hypothetical protein AWB68_08876 [Caballeronia choica]
MVVPVGFECIGNHPVCRIDIHIATAGEIGFVTHAFQLLQTHGIGLLNTPGDLVLDCERYFDGGRPNRLHEQRTDCIIDRAPTYRLAPLARIVSGDIVTYVVRFHSSACLLIAHTHAIATYAANDATL